MRIAVDGTGYTSAAAACASANHVAAAAYADLVGQLAAYTAMAGDSATSADFAATYDEAAAGAVGVLAGAVEAFATVGRLAYASLANHVDADRRAMLPGAQVYDGHDLPPEGAYAAVLPRTPPTSLGGDPSSLPGALAWVLDQVESFVWPDADVAKLREAATTWRAGGTAIEQLVDQSDRVIRALGEEQSPEIPVAIGAVRDLKGTLCDVANQYAALAGACDDYATEVEQQREAILDLVHDLVRDTVVIAGAGAALSILTAGGSVAAATAATAARIAAAAPRLDALVGLIRAAASGASAAIRVAGTVLARAGETLSRFRGVVTAREARLLSTRAIPRLHLDTLSRTIHDPRLLDPHSLRGLSKRDLDELLTGWTKEPSSRGSGLVYGDPFHSGRRIRVMDGYPGNRPDRLTHGPYAVVSQNGSKTKVPLDGNGVL